MPLYEVSRRVVSGGARERSAGPRRWVLRTLLGLAGFAWLVVIALLILVHQLDRPWIKRHVQTIARDSAGVDVDYRSVRIALFSGVVVEGLVVHSPAEMRDLAPDLIAVDRVEARWSTGSLFGHGPAIEQIALRGVALTVVVDERGRTSFDALPQSTARPDHPPALPLSQRAASLLAGAPAIGKVSVDRTTLTLVRSEQGHMVERTELRGASATLAATPASTGWGLTVGIGSPATPLALEVEREQRGVRAGSARAAFWFTLDATSSALTAGFDVRVLEQTFAPSFHLADRLHAEASVQFDPAAGRTVMSIEHTDLGEGAATVEASIEIPDSGAPVVRHAQGDADLARLLLWVPAGLVPVNADRAHVHYAIDALVAGPIPHLADGGKLALDADLAGVKANLATGPLEIALAKLSLNGRSAPDGGSACAGGIELSDAHLATAGEHLAVENIALDFDGRQGTDGTMTGHVGLGFARASLDGSERVDARDGHLDLHVDGLHPGDADPLATRGDLVLSVGLASLEARWTGGRSIVDQLTVRAHALLEGHAPYAGELESKASRLRVFGPVERPLADAPFHFTTTLRDVYPDSERPEASRATVHAAVDLGEWQVSLDATKAIDAVDFALRAGASSLKALATLLPPDLAAAAPWDRAAIAIRSSGHVEGLSGANPELRQTTNLEIDRPAFRNVAAKSVSLDLRTDGTAVEQKVDADLRAQALALDGDDPSDDRVKIAATIDRHAPSLRLRIETSGRADSNLSASLSFDPQRRAALYDIAGTLGGLAPLAGLVSNVHGLDGFDLSKLEVGLSARGAVLGLVASAASDGTLALEPNLRRTAGVEGTVDVRVAHFRWTRGDTAIVTPAASWHADMHVAGTRRTLDSRVEIGAMHLAVGPHEVELAGLSDETSASVTGDLANPEAELSARASIRDVAQDVIAGYPIGGLAFTLAAQRDPEGLVHVSDLKLVNGAGGTTLALTGSLDLGARRRRLSLAAQAAQDLAALSSTPARFAGRGTVSMDAKVDSPNLALFRSHVDLKLQDVQVRMPRAGIDVEAANGVIPTTATFAIGRDGEDGKTIVTFPRDEHANPYSMLRFADQHALLSRTGFISVGSIKTPFVSIAPLAGNLAVDQNVVSLSQFEMGLRGGKITGQCALDWDGPRSTLELHVRASGVQSSHGEPFDGNVAVVVAASDRTVEGRADVLRIGPRHLLDLLDMEDPTRVDPAMNRVRELLAFGYPKRLRLVFDHGFASARLELGGLASLVSIDELSGLPMGPIVDRFLGPLFDTKEAP